MRRIALLTGSAGLVVVLAGCGGTVDDSTLGASSTAGSSASTAASPTGAASPSASSGATPGAGATSSASPQACPLKARTVPAPAGVSADLSAKPTIGADAAPPPTDVTVADVAVGTGAEATTLSAVEVKYVGVLYTSGTEFDSSWKTSADTTLPFTVCADGVIPGFAIAPTGMRVGGRRVVTIPAQYGYGAAGSPPTIPADAPLVFIIDLVKVTPPAS